MIMRLAYHPEGGATLKAIRLAYNPGPINQYNALAPTIFWAHSPGAQGDNVLMKTRKPLKPSKDFLPALLVSFVYLEPFLKNRDNYQYRDWVLDSGAFSAWKSNMEIDIDQYTETCRHLLAEDPTLTEVFALDVIGDWKGTLRNTEYMWEHGVPAIPAFHYGEPEEALLKMAKMYPKIALGGIVGLKSKEKKRWIGQCFARVWPKKIHGFGVGTEDLVMSFPFHSVDATNWELGPCGFGRWNSFGKMSVRGSKQDLRAEVEWYLKLERRARQRWGKEMEKLEASEGPTIRLAEVYSGRNRNKGLDDHPSGHTSGDRLGG